MESDSIQDVVYDDGEVLHLTKLARIGVSPTLYVDVNGFILERSREPSVKEEDGLHTLRDAEGYTYNPTIHPDLWEDSEFYRTNGTLINEKKSELEQIFPE